MQTISNSTYASPNVSMRMPRAQKEALDDAAARLGITSSELIRRGIAYMIEASKETAAK